MSLVFLQMLLRGNCHLKAVKLSILSNIWSMDNGHPFKFDINQIVLKNIIWKFSFRFADSYNMPLFETSAKNDDKCDHVEAIFLTLAHKINANKLLFKTREELESTSTVQVTSTASVEEESGYCCF